MLVHLCSNVLSSKYHELVLECGISLTIPVFHICSSLLCVCSVTAGFEIM